MIHLIVGNTGSGKTTYAKALQKKTKGVIFSIDNWNKELFLPDKKETDGLEWFLERIDRSESVIMDLIFQLEYVKTDTILDLGLSKVSHREKFKNFANRGGFDIRIHYLDISKEIRLKRVLQRNLQKGDSYAFEVTRENFDFMEDWFEKPGVTELNDAIVIKE